MKNVKDQIDYWKKSAGRNWKSAQGLLKLKHYDACLFFCHLALEKVLKGLIVQRTSKPAPFIRDLENLALIAKLSISEEQTKNLKTITRFNIGGRYDDTKFEFYKQCTKSYTEKYFNISKELYLWLKKQYQKK
jgi:HEPN domain-containing protein